MSQSSASGRFLLRLEPGLHSALRRAAAESRLSLNDYCARKLAAPLGNLAAVSDASRTVSRAAGLFGDRLVGVAAFGSWARREAVAASDVDVLVVVDPEIPITRQLYREWDEEPIAWEGRPTEPHFVQLPPPGTIAAGLWAEVALDGVVLFERGLALSAHLVRVRRDIVGGRLVRRVVHGQPYWTEVRAFGADHVRRAEVRLRAIEVLLDAQSWADVVRESQEVVELTLKGLLRASGIEAPRIHDVSDVLLAERHCLPDGLEARVEDLAAISRDLRRDRELAFYGAEDLTPSSFYSRADAERALDGARLTVATVKPFVPDAG